MRKEKMMHQCCVCRKFKRKDEYKFTNRAHMDEWGHHIGDLDELAKEFDIVFSHGYCDECVKPIRKRIDELRRIRYLAFDKKVF